MMIPHARHFDFMHSIHYACTYRSHDFAFLFIETCFLDPASAEKYILILIDIYLTSILICWMQKVQHELLVVYANQLLEKEHSGCRALLRDDKVEQLSLCSYC